MTYVPTAWVNDTPPPIDAVNLNKIEQGIYDIHHNPMIINADWLWRGASILFEGAAGLLFGSCYGNHVGWSQANAVQNTWYNISDANMLDGEFNRVTHDGNGKLTVTEPGMYLVTYSMCYEDTIANDHLEVGIEVNGSGAAEGAGQTHSENKFANEEEHLSGCAILSLIDNATIELAIRTTDGGTPDISVQGLNLSVVQIGGI